MTVNDSSFSFFEVGIASNQIETEMRTWAGGGTPQKNDIDRIFKRFFGGRGARPFFGLFRREKNIFPPRQIPTDSTWGGLCFAKRKKKTFAKREYLLFTLFVLPRNPRAGQSPKKLFWEKHAFLSRKKTNT
jgi:hypothetical protein